MEGPVSTSVQKEMEIRDSIQPEAAQTIGNTTYIVGTFQTVGRRQHNEDRLKVVEDLNACAGDKANPSSPPRAFFGCYDGHGGNSCSDYCREELHNIILENVERLPHDIAQATFDAFMRFEVQYLECIDDVTAGSCALTVVLQDDTLHVANCGDCRAVLYKASANKTVSITRDHSPDEESELLRIEMAGGKVTQEVRQVRTSCCGLWTKEMRGAARVQPGSLAVSRSLGDCTLKSMHDPPIIITDPETFQVPLDESCTFLILATDGVWGAGGGGMTSDEATRCVWAAIKMYKKLGLAKTFAKRREGSFPNNGNRAPSGVVLWKNLSKIDPQNMNLAEYAAWSLVKESAYRASSRHVACDNCSAMVIIFPTNLPKGFEL